MAMHVLKVVVKNVTNEDYIGIDGEQIDRDIFDIPVGDTVCTPDGDFECCKCRSVIVDDIDMVDGCLGCDIWHNMTDRTKWCRMLACTPSSRGDVCNVVFKRTFERCETQKGE